MKTSTFKELIKEAVREVVREELRPVKKALIENLINKPKTISENRGEKLIFGKTNQPLRPASLIQNQPIKKIQYNSNNPIMDLLQETKDSMNGDDYNTLIKGESSQANGFDPTSLAAEMGYQYNNGGQPSRGVSSGLVESINPDITNGDNVASILLKSSPNHNVKGPEEVGEIEVVPDFSNFMNALKSKGKI